MSGGGTSNAALIISATQLFNGTAWTAGGNLNVSRFSHGCAGSQNACFVVGGQNAAGAVAGTLASQETFNGSSWSSSTFSGVDLSQLAVAGTKCLSTWADNVSTRSGKYSNII